MVSFTAMKTYFIFSVSVAVVKWWNNALSLFLLTLSNISKRKDCTSLMSSGSPWKFGRYSWKFERASFSPSRSVLLRNRMMETSLKHLLLTMVSKMLQLSSRRGVVLSSMITWEINGFRKDLVIPLFKYYCFALFLAEIFSTFKKATPWKLTFM